MIKDALITKSELQHKALLEEASYFAKDYTLPGHNLIIEGFNNLMSDASSIIDKYKNVDGDEDRQDEMDDYGAQDYYEDNYLDGFAD